jgi:hypothetical protein
LHTLAPAVDDADLGEPTLHTRIEVRFHHGEHVLRPEGMEVDLLGDGKLDRLRELRIAAFLLVAQRAPPEAAARR